MKEATARSALIEIALTGDGPWLRVDGGDVLRLRSRRAAALVAYLALAPGYSASRERLADLLWGDRGADQARASLRQCLLELRQLHPAALWLDADRTRVALAGQQIRVDVHEAVARISASITAADALDALALLGDRAALGNLKAGLEVDNWVLEARATIERALTKTVVARIERFATAHDPRSARELADAYLALHPDEEAVTVQAMRAEVALGEGPAALRRFDGLKRTLARDLGCAPGAAASRLRDTIVAGGAADPPSSEHAAPPATTNNGLPLVLVPEIATLPGDPHATIAVALREEILAGLARFRDIRLCSRADLVHRSEMSADEARRAYALVLTLHGHDAGTRLVARVARVSDDAIVWADTLDLGRIGTADGVAMVVRRVIATVLPAVADHFFRALDGRTDGPYDAYLSARHRSITCWRYEDLIASAVELGRIITESPDFAPAYAPLARLLNTDYFYSALGSSGPLERRRALDLARTAVTLDPQDAHNHAVLGFCHLWHDQPALARKRFDRVLDLNPYNIVRLYEVATGLTYLGALGEARALLDRTNALGLGHSDAFHEDMARLLIAEGRYGEALSDLDLVTRPNIQTGLYAAMAAHEIRRGDADALIGAWRADVVMRWKTAPGPTAATIAQWISNHHPFAPVLKQRFMAAAERMLDHPTDTPDATRQAPSGNMSQAAG